MIDLDDLFGATSAPTVQPVKLLEPGIYPDLPAAEYHALPYISSTLLKNYTKLPSTARIPYVCGDDANVGSGCHAFSLQGQAGLESECFILPPECEGKSAKALESRAYHMSINSGLVALPHQYGPSKVPIMDVLRGVDTSLNAHPKTGPVLRNSQKELSIIWIDEDSGCVCKARLDIWEAAEQTIWDLKKCRSIAGFQWQIKDLFYGVQAGHYFNGAIACGLPAVAFGFIPCEAFPPYQVACGYVDPEKLEKERMNARRIIGLVKQSQLTGNWPNFPIPGHIFDLNDIMPDDLVNVY